MTTYTMKPESIVILGQMGEQIKAEIEKIEMPIIEHLYIDYYTKDFRNYSVSGTWDKFTSQEILEQIQKCFGQAFVHSLAEVREIEQNLKMIQYGKEILATNMLTNEITEVYDAMNGSLVALEKAKVTGPFDLFTLPTGNRKARRARGSRKQVNITDIRTVQREKKFRDPYSQKRNTRL